MNFQEKQSFWTWWMILLMVFLLLSTLNFKWAEWSRGNFSQFSLNPGFWIVFCIIALFSVIRLKTTINTEGINIQFFPFLLKSKIIPWTEIGKIYVRDYNPIGDYGGWGYRNGSEGKAYNTKGKQGLQLIFKDGSKLLIGTQKRDELENIVEKINKDILGYENL
ncbi:hypothetical protein LZQ00_14235 [Sphingobacterium sp. SRCM116780]|uniref:hypothetical protein n=1 Tax=Sphingobacterium sp. SRCM116780 TaxID=2907623 RepID=UPI001F3AFD8E|nr:hypothetical protein [Sphingobacterium sp. SRCM116780]UIR55420.1 hypothetical protein LZQ00_14235 [Sphingobacterium sp. SRCM116780]